MIVKTPDLCKERGSLMVETGSTRTAVFAGCARDCAGELSGTIVAIERMAAAFDDYAVVMVENDSVDDTKRVLADWAARNCRVHIINVDGLGREKLSRTGRMAKARNAFLDWVKREGPTRYRFMIVFDADGLLSEDLKTDAVVEAIAYLDAAQDRVAAFSNSYPVYYDVWTLRHDTWCPTDCFYEFETQRAQMGDVKAIHRFVNDRQIPVAMSSPPIEVRSAFGGLGIYKTDALATARYSADTETGMDACEHVAFNEQVGQSGRMFIMPKLMVQAPLVHTITGSNRTKWLTLSANGKTAKLLSPNGEFPDAFRLTDLTSIEHFILLLRLVHQSHIPGCLIDFEGGIGDTASLCRLWDLGMSIRVYESSSFLYRHALENQRLNSAILKDVSFNWGRLGRNLTDNYNLFTSPPTIDLLDVIQTSPASIIRLRLEDLAHVSHQVKSDLGNGTAIIWIQIDFRRFVSQEGLADTIRKVSMSDMYTLLFDAENECVAYGILGNIDNVLYDVMSYFSRRLNKVLSTVEDQMFKLVLFPACRSHVATSFLSASEK